jgi:hypothetical protein
MPEGAGEEQTAVVAGKCRQRCKCFVPTNTAKPCVPSSCWLSTRLHCSTPDIFVHRQRDVLRKETIPLSAANTYISSDIRKRMCGTAFTESLNGCFQLCESVWSCVDFLSTWAETLIISTTNHENNDFFKKIFGSVDIGWNVMLTNVQQDRQYQCKWGAFEQPLLPWKKLINITNSDCVCVALCVQHKQRMRRNILSPVACVAVPYTSHYLIKARFSGEKKLSIINVCRHFLYKVCLKHFLF